jgi:DUF4097 and DUF4098 domain-containing protein YvlB
MGKAIVAATAILAMGCAQQAAVVEETQPVEVGSVVEMYTFNGDVSVEWYQGTEMDLSYQKTTWRGEAELDKVEVTVSEEGHATIIRAEKLQEGAQVGVDLDVRLPEGVGLGRVETSNGNVTVTGGSGDAIVDTSNGDIVFRGFAGSVRGDTSNGDIVVLGGTLRSADTSNGEIEAEIRSVQGSRTVLDTSNGNIDVYISPELDLKVIMDTSNGSVSVSGLPVADLWIEDSEGTATLNAGTHELVLDTSNGDVRVYGLDDVE